MSFEDNRKLPTQEHFYIIEIDLPIVTGTCEITVGNEGYGTPLSCPIQDGTSTISTKTYYFTTPNAPIPLNISPVYRCVSGVNEMATELTNGKGLAIRGRATVSFKDFPGLDPNPERSSTEAIKDQGTFFGKFLARNVVENKTVRIKKYRKSPNVNLSTDAEISYYVARELNNNGKGKYSLYCADELSKIEFDQSQYPKAQEGFLRLSIDDSTTILNVDSTRDWLEKTPPYVIRIGDEVMTVLSVDNNQAANARLNVKGRGIQVGPPEYSNVLTFSRASEHDAGDEVFICEAFSDANVADVLRSILLNADVDDSKIPLSDWYNEVAIWHPTDFVSGIFYESESSNNALLRILEPYLMDLWFDPIDNEIKLKAISEWQESSSTLTEGIEIDFESITLRQKEEMRYSRAFISYRKPWITDPEEPSSYKNASVAIRTEVEEPELYDIPKIKQFNNSYFINVATADLLVQRFVQRFGFTPVQYEWTTQERFLNFKVGDVVNVVSNETQGIDGMPNTNLRAQIIKIQPVYTAFGRQYKVTSLTYQSAAGSGGGDIVQTINSGVELNLFVQAGGPPNPINATFILDGGDFVSTTTAIPAIRAGNFAAGSKIIIILRNGADWQSRAGSGGDGDGSPGGAGGIVYDADGIDTDIYLSGADPESGTADGKLRASGGGGGGGGNADNFGLPSSGGGGGGGNGNLPGGGGNTIEPSATPATPGGIGNSTGPFPGIGGTGGLNAGDGGDGGTFGNPGTSGTAGNLTSGGAGGAAGKGLVKDGAVVKLFGDNASNFINGSGEAPD